MYGVVSQATLPKNSWESLVCYIIVRNAQGQSLQSHGGYHTSLSDTPISPALPKKAEFI